MRTCPACGGEVSDSAEFCRHCSAPIPKDGATGRLRRRRAKVEPEPEGAEQAEAPPQAAEPPPVAEPPRQPVFEASHVRTRRHEPPAFLPPDDPDDEAPDRRNEQAREEVGALARIVGLFAAVALGLSVAGLAYMWVTDLFAELDSDPQSLEDIGGALFSGLVGIASIIALFVFALLSGIVLAAIGGMIAASAARTRGAAAAVGALGSGVGFVVLVIVMAGVLSAGVPLLLPEPPGEDVAQPTPAPTEDPACVQLFGPGSEFCREGATTDIESEPPEPAGWITVENLAETSAGALPSGLVGGLVAAMLFSRRRR